jgi:hypothetical protein
MTRLAFAAVAVALGACGPTQPPPLTEAAYSCVLRPLATLGPDFMVQQRISATGHGHGGTFDAVLQKKGGTLVLVGLVAGVRAFTLREEGDQVSFEQSMGPPFPFPPRYAVIDIHRVYFMKLPRAPDAPPTGVTKGELDGETVEESWSNGSLVERRFSRPGEHGSVRIEYGAGCTAARCLPATVRIVNEWFGYEVRVDNGDFVLL